MLGKSLTRVLYDTLVATCFICYKFVW